MKAYSGIFNGTGAALYIGLGFVPSEVLAMVIDQAQAEVLEWNTDLQKSAIAPEGILRAAVGDTPGFALKTKGTGIALHYGGEMITAASTAKIIAASMVEAYQGDMRQKTGNEVNKFVLDTSGNATGHFNVGIDTDLVGVGSPVCIRDTQGIERTFYITALTNDGDADDEVTLNLPAGSGRVTFIGYKYDFVACPAGMHFPAGIVINDTTNINASGQKNRIRAVNMGL
jgi:hypothetical protein